MRGFAWTNRAWWRVRGLRGAAVVTLAVAAWLINGLSTHSARAQGVDDGVTTPAGGAAVDAGGSAGSAGAWAKRRLIRFGGDDRYEPLEWTDREGKAQGLHVELIRAMGQVLDADVEITLGPWHEIFAKLERGEIDVAAMAKQPERVALVEFCDPHTASVSEIFIRRDGVSVRALEDLSGKTILVQQAGLAAQTLRTRVPLAVLREVDSQTEALTRLAAGEGDAAVAEQLTSRLIIRKNGLSNLASTGPAVLASDYAFAVGKGRTDLRDDLNRALAVVKNTGAFNTLFDRSVGEPGGNGVSVRRALVWGVGIGGPLLALLAGAVAWNHALRRRVRFATAKLERELAERNRAEEQTRLLLAELDHRVRNTLASIVGLVQQSPVHDTTTAERFKAVLLERVRAMGAAHDAMRKAPAEGVQVASALAMLLRTVEGSVIGRIHVEGGSVRLSTQATTPVCLVLHELVSNAAMWGALRPVSPGLVRLLAKRDERGGVRIEWDERDPTVEAGSLKQGFGMAIMRGLIEHQLGGEFSWEIGDGGVRCVIDIPPELTSDPPVTIDDVARTPVNGAKA